LLHTRRNKNRGEKYSTRQGGEIRQALTKKFLVKIDDDLTCASYCSKYFNADNDPSKRGALIVPI
jgi:hypothetical protein